jgi:sterol 14-demethylase
MSAATDPGARAAERAAGGGPQHAPVASGSLPLLGHLLELRRNPLATMQRVHDECGEAGVINLAGNPITLFYGAKAQEAVFRAPDEQLDQGAAYPFMKPVFGPGVVFDATPEQRKQAMRNQSLRDQFMRGHAELIASEVLRMTERWGDSGEFDVLDFFSELTLYTSSACLIGKGFRDEIGPELVPIFKDLERGTDAFAYVNPHLPLPSFWRRDRARKKLVGILEGIFARREREGGDYGDLFHILHNLKDKQGVRRYTDEQITGMFISMMFAGHHTSSVVASWGLLEMLLNPEWMAKVQAEIDEIYADGREVSYQALREIPMLECCLKETLRLHPPLIILMRKVMRDFHYGDFEVPAGGTVAVSPAISNRMPEHFPDPLRFDPMRYTAGRNEDSQSFAWIPFGGGRHRCVGAAFAMMQLKAIFSILLSRYEFELAQPREQYGNDYSKMVVAVKQPCLLRYRRREATRVVASSRAATEALEAAAARPYRIEVDLDLCQGHGVCVNEAPEVFDMNDDELKVRILEERPSEEHRPPVESALRHCPTRAIRLVEE